MESRLPNRENNLLQECLNHKSQDIDVVILSWYYSVSASLPKYAPEVGIDWEGRVTTKSKKTVQVSGKFIIADDSLQQSWSGDPCEVGEVVSFEGSNTELYPYLSVEVRISDTCCSEIRNAFVLGLSCRDKGRVMVKLKIKNPTLDECAKIGMRWSDAKKGSIAAVERFYVYAAGSCEQEQS